MSQFKPFGDLPRRMPRPSHAKGMQFDTPPHSPPFMDVGIPPSYQRLLSSSPVDSKALSRGDDACSIVTDSSSIRQRPASRAASLYGVQPPLSPVGTQRSISPPPVPQKSSSPTSDRRIGPKSPLRASVMASGRNTPASLAVKVPSIHELDMAPPSIDSLWRSDSVKTSGSTIRSESEDGAWDSYDSTPSTPMRDGFQPPLSTPLAVQFVQTGKGVLSVVSSEDDAPRRVTSSTTHLSMVNCPLPSYDMLRIPNMLVVLDMSSSHLSALPESLALCTSLEELNISCNPLGTSNMAAPMSCLRALENLRVLLVDDCKLPVVPHEILSLERLQILGLRQNRLTCLPSWMHALDYLDCLLLAGNTQWTPAWKAIVGPLLHPSNDPPSPATNIMPTTPTVNTQISPKPPPIQSPSEARKRSGGFLNKLKTNNRTGAQLDGSSLVRAPSRAGTVSDTASISSAASVTTDSPVRSSNAGGLRVPHQTPTRTYMVPLPRLGQLPSNSHETRSLSCFLPVYADNGDRESVLAWYARVGTSYVRNLRAYLRDMDELLPERHRQVPQTASSVADSSGFGSPIMTSGDASDSTPSGTAGEVSSRHSILEDVGETNKTHVKDNAAKRYCVLREIIETERTYVAGLSELMDIYVKRARQPMDGVSDERVMSVEKERIIFGHIEVIIQFHQGAFLPELERKTAALFKISELDEEQHASLSAQVAADVANVFSEYATYFKMYTNYVNQYETALKIISQWHEPISPRVKSAIKSSSTSLASIGQRFLNIDPALSSTSPTALTFEEKALSDLQPISHAEHRRMQLFLRRCRDDPRHSQINLEGYLLLPIQRIPRYRLLLEQLVKCTSHGVLPDLDREALARALAHISLVASWVNEGKRQSEQGKRLLQWQSRLRGTFSAPLVQPHRRLVCDGPFRLCRVSKRVYQGTPPGDVSGPRMSCDEDFLEQMTMDLPLHLLLCNDLIAAVSSSVSSTDDASPISGKSRVMHGLASGETGALDLVAVLKPQVHMLPPGMHKTVMLPPASVVGPSLLRIVDAKYIYYFMAPSHTEAQRWQSFINAQV